MIPLRDHNPSGKTPWVTYGLIAVNIVVFGLTMLMDTPALERFVYSFAVIPAAIIQGRGLVSLITSMFLHGGWAHLLGNLWFLHIFGDNIEDALGHGRFLVFYLTCGLTGSILQILVSPGSTIPMLGASGAIAGVMGGYLAMFPRARVDTLVFSSYFTRRVTLPAYYMLFYWLVIQLVSGVGNLPFMGVGGGVAYFAHLGGFAGGYFWARVTVQPPRGARAKVVVKIKLG